MNDAAKCVVQSVVGRYSEEALGIVKQFPERPTDVVTLRGTVFRGLPAECEKIRTMLILRLQSVFDSLEAQGIEIKVE